MRVGDSEGDGSQQQGAPARRHRYASEQDTLSGVEPRWITSMRGSHDAATLCALMISVRLKTLLSCAANLHDQSLLVHNF